MLNTINHYLEKGMPIITPLSLIFGMLFASLLDTWIYLVPWVFAFVTFASTIGVKISKIKSAVKKPLPIILCLLIIQIVMPIVAYGLGMLVFPQNSLIIVGLVIAFVIPTGVISLMWVSIHNGNSSVSLLIVLLNTLLSPVLIPLSIYFFVGQSVTMDTIGLMIQLLWMICLPSLIGISINYLPLTKNKDIKSYLAPFAKLGLFFVIAINGSVVVQYFRELTASLLLIFVVIFILASLGYFLGFFISKLCSFDNDVTVSIVLNSGMRNISLGAAIAVLYFPPIVSLPIIACTLFQQIQASLFGHVLSKYLSRNQSVKTT